MPGVFGSFFALLASIALLYGGNTLMGTLLPVRAGQEGFSAIFVGGMGTGYFIGFILGCQLTPWLVRRVGHIRAFAVFAALTAVTALAYSAIFHPVAWILLRLINGFCIAGLTATIESWLNTQSSNQTRGRVLGFYMLTFYLAIASGQSLVNLADPGTPDLFMLAAALIGLVVLALTERRAAAERLRRLEADEA